MFIQPQLQWNSVGIPEQNGRLRWCIGDSLRQSWTPNVVLKFSAIRNEFADDTYFGIEFLRNDGLQVDLFKSTIGQIERVEYQHFVSSATGVDLCGGIRAVMRSGRMFLCLINGAIIEEEAEKT